MNPPPPGPPVPIRCDNWMLCVIQASSPWVEMTSSPSFSVTSNMGIVVPLMLACMTCPPHGPPGGAAGAALWTTNYFRARLADRHIWKLTGTPSAGVGLGDVQPAIGVGPAGGQAEVAAVPPLRHQQAEVE